MVRFWGGVRFRYLVGYVCAVYSPGLEEGGVQYLGVDEEHTGCAVKKASSRLGVVAAKIRVDAGVITISGNLILLLSTTLNPALLWVRVPKFMDRSRIVRPMRYEYGELQEIDRCDYKQTKRA